MLDELKSNVAFSGQRRVKRLDLVSRSLDQPSIVGSSSRGRELLQPKSQRNKIVNTSVVVSAVNNDR